MDIFKLFIQDSKYPESPLTGDLPPELLSEIFKHTLPPWTILMPYTNLHDATYRKRLSALDLGAVCSRWRTIAWTTPSLWSALHIHATPRNIQTQLALLDEWFSRTGVLPLDIAISAEPRRFWNNEDVYEELVVVAHKYSLRWRSLLLQIPGPGLRVLREPPNLPLPLLESVRLEPPYEAGHFWEWALSAVCLGQATALSNLVLGVFFLSSSTFHFDSLTDLTLLFTTPDDCLLVLSRCPQLIRCHFNVIKISGNLTLPSHLRITHPSLQSLILKDAASGDQSLVLETIVAPVLREFQSRTLTCDVSAMCRLLRGSPKLQSFSLEDDGMDQEDFLNLLSTLSVDCHLKSFAYSIRKNWTNSPLNDAALTILALRRINGRPYFLPMLEAFKYSGPQAFDLSTLIAMWHSRKAHQSEKTEVDQEQFFPGWKTSDITLYRTMFYSEPIGSLLDELRLVQHADSQGRLRLMLVLHDASVQ